MKEVVTVLLLKSANEADGIGDIEGKAATGSGERTGKQASFKSVDDPRSGTSSPGSVRLHDFADEHVKLAILLFAHLSNLVRPRLITTNY